MRAQLYTFTAIEASLPSLLNHLATVASALGEDTRLRAQTALEELFANTVKHGYTGMAESIANYVWFAVWMDGETLHVCYEDAAPRFNPFEDLASVVNNAKQPLELRPAGGLGRLMVQGLSDAANYTWVETESGGRNRIDLTFRPRKSLPSS